MCTTPLDGERSAERFEATIIVKKTICALVGATAIAVSVVIASGGRASSGPPTGIHGGEAVSSAGRCHFSNVFSSSPAALRACGLLVFPLSAVKPLPGGGRAYIYNEGKYGVVTELVPPKHFDPLTASEAQLNEYGFPPRPTDSHALTLWKQELGSWKGPAQPQPFDVADPYWQMGVDHAATTSLPGAP